MIDKLTKEQKAKFPEFVDKWLKIGLCTDRVDREQVIDVCNKFYDIILHKPKVPVFVFNDPIQAYFATLWLSNLSEKQVWSQVGSQVGPQVWSQVRSQVESQVESQVQSQVESQVESQVRSQVESQVYDFIWPYADGHLWSGWFSFYDYMEYLGLKFSDACQIWKSTSILGVMYSCDNVCCVSQKPIKIKMLNGQLHAEGETSLEYADGNVKLYNLHGVQVPDWLVLTKDVQIDPAKVIEIENADVRREFVRKVGYDRLYYKLGGKQLDKKEIAIFNGREMFMHRYEVLQLNVGNGRKWNVLKMINPSLSANDNEVYHIEGLPPTCDTVEKAINFRKPEKMKTIKIDDVNGQSYYQHGDRVCWPQGAKSLKMYPSVLT